jgi:hypothetical protein
VGVPAAPSRPASVFPKGFGGFEVYSVPLVLASIFLDRKSTCFKEVPPALLTTFSEHPNQNLPVAALSESPAPAPSLFYPSGTCAPRGGSPSLPQSFVCPYGCMGICTGTSTSSELAPTSVHSHGLCFPRWHF